MLSRWPSRVEGISSRQSFCVQVDSESHRIRKCDQVFGVSQSDVGAVLQCCKFPRSGSFTGDWSCEPSVNAEDIHLQHSAFMSCEAFAEAFRPGPASAPLQLPSFGHAPHRHISHVAGLGTERLGWSSACPQPTWLATLTTPRFQPPRLRSMPSVPESKPTACHGLSLHNFSSAGLLITTVVLTTACRSHQG